MNRSVVVHKFVRSQVTFCNFWFVSVCCCLSLVQAQICEEGECTNTEWCANEYNNQTKSFKRIYWGLQSVPCDIPAEAERVNLAENYINILIPNVFSHLGQCSSVSLHNNGLATVKPGAFNGLSNLLELALYANRLSMLSNGMWTGLEKLEDLHVESNKISRISAGTFQGLATLKILRVANNNIVILEKGAFAGLESLHELYLDRNYLPTLDQETFRDLPRPLVLSVRHYMGDRHAHVCSSLCWIKEEEQQGTIVFAINRFPHCNSGVQWKDLQCDGKSFGVVKLH